MLTPELAAAALSKSPVLRAAFRQTVQFCADNRITDEEVAIDFMMKVVKRLQAELEDTLVERREEIVDALLKVVWAECREGRTFP